MLDYPILKNNKGTIRKSEEKDCASLRFLYDAPITLEQAQGLMTRMDSIYKKKEEMILAFTDEEDELVGLLELYHFQEHQVEIGYRTIHQQQGKGYTRNAVQLLIPWLLENGYRIVAKVHPLNEPSRQILIRNGFQCVHTNEKEEEYLFERKSL